jgi:hypothetical protein
VFANEVSARGDNQARITNKVRIANEVSTPVYQTSNRADTGITNDIRIANEFAARAAYLLSECVICRDNTLASREQCSGE